MLHVLIIFLFCIIQSYENAFQLFYSFIYLFIFVYLFFLFLLHATCQYIEINARIIIVKIFVVG